jgi:multiple sugar transport system substrate-binding protein
VDVIWVAELARAGWIRDLDHLLPPEAWGEYFAGPIEAVTYGGRARALPWFIDAGLLYYRKDLLAEHGLDPPETWPELVETAQRVLAGRPDMHGFVWQGKQYEGLVCNVLEYVWSNGGDVLRGDEVVLDSPENHAALQFVQDLIHTHAVTPAFVTTATEEPARQIFGRGDAVFLRNWPYAWHLFEQEGSAVQGRVGMRALPSFPGHEPAATLGGWQLAVNAHSRHPEAAERFAQFLTSAESQRTLALEYGLKPTRSALYDDPQLLAAQPALAGLQEVFARARPRPVSPQYVRMSLVMQAEFSAVVAGLRSPQEALAAAQRELEAILAR